MVYSEEIFKHPNNENNKKIMIRVRILFMEIFLLQD